MSSLMAAEVAKDNIKAVVNGKKPNSYKSHLEHGYTKSSAKSHKALQTKTYKVIMSDFIGQLKKIQAKILKQIETEVDENKKSTLRDKVYAFDLLIKNSNLLENKPTEINKEVKEIKTAEEAKEYLKEALRVD